ncbi:ATP-dependent Clp protease proteolytic subunit [Serratia ureilytica]
MTAEEAVEYGLVDGILDTPQLEPRGADGL